jgi:sister chromatid cohesion protein PDS5
MPRATRRRASSPVAAPVEEEIGEQELEEVNEDDEMAEEDEEAEDEAAPQHTTDGVAKLRFKQELNWRAGRPIAVAELLRRLESLSRELQGYEQDEVAVDSLQTTAKELASTQLLAHKDKGVKALAASCVVDVFRLCAPNAPYTQQQMKVCGI